MSTPAALFPRPLESGALLALGRRAADGDAEARRQLLRSVAPRIATAVRAVMGSAHHALDDATQHALIAFVQAMQAFRGECDPSGYARVIAVRAAIAVRTRERAPGRREDTLEADEHAASSRGADDLALAERRRGLLRELLAELPEAQAEALALRVMFGHSLEEVAAQTGAPLNTVRSRVRLAKERLRARIEADPELRAALEVEP